MTSGSHHLFLDSGAFSVWSRGKTIDLDQYSEFLLAHHQHFTLYATLDQIPGRKGRSPTILDYEEAATTTWGNTKRLERRGLRPLYVVHCGESIKWIDRAISEGYDYIGLGGLVGTPDARRLPWLDQVFALARGRLGFHGFGMMNCSMLTRYPWVSIDSSGPILGAATGDVLLPRAYITDGCLVLDPRSFFSCPIGRLSSMGGSRSHFLAYGPEVRALYQAVMERCGSTWERLSTNPYERARISTATLLKAARSFRRHNWGMRHRGYPPFYLVTGKLSSNNGYFMAGWLGGARSHLISFVDVSTPAAMSQMIRQMANGVKDDQAIPVARGLDKGVVIGGAGASPSRSPSDPEPLLLYGR